MKPQNLFTKSQSCVELSQLNSCIASDRIGWEGGEGGFSFEISIEKDWENLFQPQIKAITIHFEGMGENVRGSLCVLCYFCLYWRCKTHGLPSRWSESISKMLCKTHKYTHRYSHAVRNTGPSFVYNTVYTASVKKCYLYGISVYQAPTISPRVRER